MAFFRGAGLVINPGIPLNHWYNPEDGKIYFHGAKAGHKIDAIKADDKVSYCVYDAGYRKEGEWALNVNSVVIFGHISLVTDEEKARMIGENLCRKFCCYEGGGRDRSNPFRARIGVKKEGVI